MTIALPARRRTLRRSTSVRLEVALVNLMPDAAFEEAERQFSDLVTGGAGPLAVHISRYALTEIPRSNEVAGVVRSRYRDLSRLFKDRPHAVVVTGTEPRCAQLPEEEIWQRLSTLYRWAESSGTAVLSSCLASHAALLALDGVGRRPLPAKLSGVFAQWVHPRHPLTEGVAGVACPHSRLNEVPVEALELRGYRVLVGSAEVGWSVAMRDRGCLSVLCQGHPEYDATTLLREYRRDVRRYLEGVGVYPPTPVGYLDPEGVGLLELFKLAANTSGADPSLMESFPFHLCAEHICAHWKGPMERLVGNWLREVARRAATAG